MKTFFFMLFFFLLICSFTQQEDNKTFNLDKAKIDGISLNKISKEDIVSKFGKPIRVTLDTNEFTGENFYMYYYNGISFEVSESGKSFPDEISSTEIAINYSGKLIQIGNDIIELQKEFPQYDFNLSEGQVSILIRNTTASYLQIYIVNRRIKGISFTENY